MKAKLAGIASHTGMSWRVHLRAATYAVAGIEQLTWPAAPAPVSGLHRLSVLRLHAQRIAACADLEALTRRRSTDRGRPGVSHSMLILDAAGERLYTVASRGYGASGVGSEIPLGEA